MTMYKCICSDIFYRPVEILPDKPAKVILYIRGCYCYMYTLYILTHLLLCSRGARVLEATAHDRKWLQRYIHI